MLTRKTPKTLATKLTITGQGAEPVSFDLVYRNHNSKAVMEHSAAHPGDPTSTILFIVESWESEYPLTKEGVEEAEADRPGLILAVLQGFYEARGVQLAKN